MLEVVRSYDLDFFLRFSSNDGVSEKAGLQRVSFMP